MAEYDGDVRLYHGDCVEVMAGMEAESVDAVVTDPPYALSFMGREWDGTLPGQHAWEECLRVLKPGGHLLAFGGSRTFHRLTCAIEDAGFEVRDCLSWLYGSGFPKSLDVSKAIDKAAGVEGTYGAPKSEAHAGWIERGRMRGDDGHEGYQRPWMQDGEAVDRNARQYEPATPEAVAWQGWGTALKPAWEPIVVARKPLAGTVAGNVLAHGTGAINVDGCRVGTSDNRSRPPGRSPGSTWDLSDREEPSNSHPAGRWPANVVLSHTPDCRQVGVRKVRNPSGPASGPTLHATRSVAHGDYDGERGEVPFYADPDGTETVPAFECSPDCPVRLLDEQAGERPAGAPIRGDEPSEPGASSYGFGRVPVASRGDTGGPSRFFYTAKASSAERDGASHPTVKPLELMRWLVRLVTPPGGLVLDPFAGSGTTLIACRLEGFRAVGIEREAEYCAMAAERYRRRWDPAAAEWNGRKEEGLAQLGLFGGAVPVVEADG